MYYTFLLKIKNGYGTEIHRASIYIQYILYILPKLKPAKALKSIKPPYIQISILYTFTHINIHYTYFPYINIYNIHNHLVRQRR